nr:hypothetical protein [Wolbachia endosymbiont of Mansonella ozzardi]
MENIDFLKFIELCFKTVMPGCEYNGYQYTKVIVESLKQQVLAK